MNDLSCYINLTTHAQCYKWSQLLHNYYLQTVGKSERPWGSREPDHAILSNLFFPYNLVTGCWYLLTAFIQFSLVSSSNHKSDLFFYGCLCFWNIIDLQHYVSFCNTTQWLGISIHLKMIMKNLVMMCHYAKVWHSNWRHSPHHTFCNRDSFILQLEACTSQSSLPISLLLALSPLWRPSVCSLLLFIMFVHLFCFLNYTCEWNNLA